jgi:uncharacterized protein YkwD
MVLAPRLRVPVAALFAALLLILAPRSATPPAYAAGNCNVADNTFDGVEQQFLTIINEYRAQHGKAALSVSENLNRAASWMANDMATRNYMGHVDSLGRSISQRLPDCDTYYSAAAENVAAGLESAQAVFNGWKGSSSHNSNMLGDYKQIGIARAYGNNTRYGWYWATEFSSVDDGTRHNGYSFARVASVVTEPSPQPVTPDKASITSPVQGSRFTAATMSFSWTSVPGASEYFIHVGTRRGANDIFGRSQALVTSTTIAGLPDDGSTVYIRLFTRIGNTWTFSDYSYRAVEPYWPDFTPLLEEASVSEPQS